MRQQHVSQGQSSLEMSQNKQQPFKPQELTDDNAFLKVTMKTDYAFCTAAILNKIIPIAMFFLLGQFKIVDFTFVLLFSSIDFWTVKNIYGKKLVAMTWWMKVNPENGDEEWIFHSGDQAIQLNPFNQNVFWLSNLISVAFWGVTMILSLLISRLFWIALCSMCFILATINFVFYLKCRGKHQEKFKEFADKVGLASAHSLMTEY